jgi:hypothetical protein
MQEATFAAVAMVTTVANQERTPVHHEYHSTQGIPRIPGEGSMFPLYKEDFAVAMQTQYTHTQARCPKSNPWLGLGLYYSVLLPLYFFLVPKGL